MAGLRYGRLRGSLPSTAVSRMIFQRRDTTICQVPISAMSTAGWSLVDGPWVLSQPKPSDAAVVGAC
jgi:hypothetical protein